MIIDERFLKISAQRAFLFNIPPGVRMISVDISQENKISALVCSDNVLNEDDRDDVCGAFGEISGDFSDVEVETDIDFVVSKLEIMDLPRLSLVLFALSR